MSASHDPALTRHIIDHMIGVLEATPYSSAPFPHFQAAGFVPDDVYRELLDTLPADDVYEPFGYDKHQTDGVTNRLRFSLTSRYLDRLESRPRVVWYSLRHAFGSRALKEKVFEKLAPGLVIRSGWPRERIGDLPGFASPNLFRETGGYSIAPHPDTRKKVVTMQFSLASDNSQAPLGTEFYSRSLNPLAWLREPRGFDTVKTMPFVPNGVYAFVVLNTITLKSWHGRTTITGHHGIRNSLLNIWYDRVFEENRELTEECQG